MSYWRDTPAATMLWRSGDGRWCGRVEIGSKLSIEATANTPGAVYAEIREALDRSIRRRQDSLQRFQRNVALIKERLYEASLSMTQS